MILGDNNDFLDLSTIIFMKEQLRKFDTVKNPVWAVRDPAQRGGAAYRKRRRIMTYELITAEVVMAQFFCL